MTDTVWVVRHGEREDQVDPDWHERATRPHDPGLTDRGFSQAERTAQRLADEPIDAVYASPYLRTVQTANVVGGALGLPLRLEAGFGEHLNPDWFEHAPEILTVPVLAERFSRVDAGYASRLRPSYPESFEQARDRVGETVRRLLPDEPETVLVVGHGLTVLGVVHELAGATDGIDVPLCSVTKLVEDDGWRLDVATDTSHLEG